MDVSSVDFVKQSFAFDRGGEQCTLRRHHLPSGRILTDALAELCHARPHCRVHGDRILGTGDVVVVSIAFFQCLNKSSRGSTWFMKEHDVLKEGWSVRHPKCVVGPEANTISP